MKWGIDLSSSMSLSPFGGISAGGPMAKAEHVVAVAVLVAPALGLATVGREEEQECDRENEKGPGTPDHPRSLHRGTSDRQSTLRGGRPLAVTQTPSPRG